MCYDGFCFFFLSLMERLECLHCVNIFGAKSQDSVLVKVPGNVLSTKVSSTEYPKGPSRFRIYSGKHHF